MAKVTWDGAEPKDSPLFTGGWIFGGRRLSDVAPRVPQDGKNAMPLCAQPEDYGIEIEEGDTFCPIEKGVFDGGVGGEE
jgi:hypothetical protein